MAGEPILIVDDTPVNLKLTRILLVNEGYTVLTAASAEEALELLRSYHPRLILADIQLPGMDGLEMTRLIKQDERTRDIAVVALTAFAMKGDEQKAMDAGCDGYITKPIDTRTLGERIRQWLTRRAESETTAVAPPPEQEVIPAAEMQALRRPGPAPPGETGAAGGAPAAGAGSHSGRRKAGAAPPFPPGRPGTGAPTACGPGRRVQRQRRRPRGAPMGGNRGLARLYRARPPGPRGGGLAPGTASRHRPGARVDHQSAPGLQHAA